MQFFSYTLSSGSLTIDSSQGAMALSIQSNDSSSCTFLGSIPFKGISPNAVTLSNGQGLTVAAQAANSPLSGITITWLSGTIDIIIGF